MRSITLNSVFFVVVFSEIKLVILNRTAFFAVKNYSERPEAVITLPLKIELYCFLQNVFLYS